MTKKTNNYIDNAKFYEEMKKYKQMVKEATERGEEKPRVTEYIGNCLYLIAENLSYKPNFINYIFREELVGDAIENCLAYADNFDPDKSQYPFAYFSKIAYYAFLRRIDKEKKQLYTKYKAIEHANMYNLVSDQPLDDTNDYGNRIENSEGSQEKIDNFIEKFEESMEIKKQKRKNAEKNNE